MVNLHCRPHPQPLSSARRGEPLQGNDTPPKVETRGNSIATNAGTPSPYEGEGWVGVSQDK
jgi:hypothetical protein